jgi:hypothetical protein
MDPRDFCYRISIPELKTKYDMLKSENTESFLKDEKLFLQAAIISIVSIGIFLFFSKVEGIRSLRTYVLELNFIAILLACMLYFFKTISSRLSERKRTQPQSPIPVGVVGNVNKNSSDRVLPFLIITVFLVVGGWKTLCLFSYESQAYGCERLFFWEYIFFFLIFFTLILYIYTRDESL